MENQTEPKTRVSHQFDVCPNCGMEIVIGWGHVSVLSPKEFQEETQRELKELKNQERELKERQTYKS